MRSLEITDTKKIDQALTMYESLGEVAFLQRFGINRSAKSVFIHKGGFSPAPYKAILYAAYSLQFPDQPSLEPYDFHSRNAELQKHIERLGYTVFDRSDYGARKSTDGQALKGYFEDKKPRIWGKGYWGFSPEDWGCVTFTQLGARQSFEERAEDGDLVMIYATNSPEVHIHERRRILGFYEIRNEPRNTRDCISDKRWREKQVEQKDQWNFAIPAIRAWRTCDIDDRLPKMADIAQDTYNNRNFTLMATRPVRLSRDDENRALDLVVTETGVFGEPFNAVHSKGNDFGDENDLKPSRGIPPYSGPRGWTEQSGPKKLYRMRLNCDVCSFLGASEREIGAQQIYKIGYSARPESRCKHFNNHLPFSNAVRWVLEEESDNFEGEQAALDAEDALKIILAERCNSLGREFFLAHPDELVACWRDVVDDYL